MIRPVAQSAYLSLLLDMPLSLSARVDFGIDTPRHYTALRNAIQDGLSMEALDAALGDGARLTEIARDYDPDIVFRTSWDLLLASDEDESDED